MEVSMDEEFLQRTYQAREEYLRRLGTLDDLLLAPLINPGLQGGPVWPDLRESWRTVRNQGRTIIVSDGLSDPYKQESDPNVGLGIEILGATDDPLEDEVQSTWLFKLVYAVSQQAAAHGGFRELIDELGLLSMELRAPSDMTSLATAKGHLGVLMGVQPPDFSTEWQLPAGLVKVITVKALHPSELACAAEKGDEGRKRLGDLFAADGSYHLSSLRRKSVI
jgi:hypothetical protein